MSIEVNGKSFETDEEGNDLVPVLNIQQNGRHFQRVRAGSSQQCLRNTQRLLEQSMAFLGEGSVAGNMGIGNGFGHVFHFAPDDHGAVEVNTKFVQAMFSMTTAQTCSAFCESK